MLIKARKVTYGIQPSWADWPAKSAMVTGPDRFFQDTWPSTILPSMRRLNTEMSQVLATARRRLSTAP